jgi:hypothetical protein
MLDIVEGLDTLSNLGLLMSQKGPLKRLNEQVQAANYETWLKDTVL